MNAAERAGVVLAILREHGGLTQAAVCEKSGLTMTQTNDALAKLIRERVLDVASDPLPRVYTPNANAEGYVPKQRGSFT